MPLRPPGRAELIGCFARRRCRLRTILCLKRGALIALAATIAFGAAPAAHASAQPRTEVVVTLGAPSLADFVQSSRVLTVQAKAKRLDLQSALSVSYLRELDARQSAVARGMSARFPQRPSAGATALSSTGSPSSCPRRASRARPHRRRAYRLPGHEVSPRPGLEPRADRRRPALGNAELHDGGQRHQDRDHRRRASTVHPFFSPRGYVLSGRVPPRADTSYTTAKVIAARAFPPPGRRPGSTRTRPSTQSSPTTPPTWPGITGRQLPVNAVSGRGPLSGVAPRAYLGNYKALTVPTSEFGLDGNAPRSPPPSRPRSRTAWT